MSVEECHPPSLERFIPALEAFLLFIEAAKSSSNVSALLNSPKPIGV